MAGEAARRRKNSKKNKEPKNKGAITTNSTSKKGGGGVQPKVRRGKGDKQEEEEESMWKTFTSHPLIQALPWVLFLFAFQASKKGIIHVTLKYPHVVNQLGLGFLNLRPAVAMMDARQLLLVGPLGSGLEPVAKELSDKLSLEVGHDITDTHHHYVRDGTASWLYFLRYLPLPKSEATKNMAMLDMCKEAPLRLGYHPSLHVSSSDCSDRETWSTCWAKECMEFMTKEWGCARWDDGCHLSTPFAKVLHQVRNPLSVVETLVATYCESTSEFDSKSDGAVLNGSLSRSFVRFNNALFTERKDSFTDLSCIEAASYHVIDYSKAMIRAREEGLIDGMYKVETSSACDVAELAGFKDKSATLYEPNYATAIVKCAFAMDPAREIMALPSMVTSNAGVSLDWPDFEGGKHGSKRKAGDMTLVKELKKLMDSLGYDPKEKRESQAETDETEK